MKGRYERKKTQKRTSKIIWMILVGLLLLSVVIACVVGVNIYRTMLGKINYVDVPAIVYTSIPEETTIANESESVGMDVVETEDVTAITEAHIKSSADYINFLVVGQAARDGESERFADTMILCTVNTYEKKLTMTSLLRDSFVKMPDYKGHTGGRIKLTTIYHLGSTYGNGIAGSMELMNLALYNNFGIEVDHNFEIDFDAFIKVIDMLGGVDIELTQAEADYLNDDDFWVYYDVEPGWAHLDGMTALCYARMRKAEGDGESDINRTNRQRKLIESLLNQLRSKSVSELTEIVNEILPLITTSMGNSEITECVLMLLPMLTELKIENGGTCPANYNGDMVDIYSNGVYHSVLRFDEVETKNIMRAITEGETS